MKLLALLLMIPLLLVSACAPANSARRVALVFDDGPVPADAEALLAILRAEKVSVTFSLVGQRVETHPETARAIAAAGHEVANHSQTHAALKDLDAAGVPREVEVAQRALTQALGRAPRWYWPPFLAVDRRLRAAVKAAGLALYPTPHLVVSKDYDPAVDGAEILRRSTQGVKDGSVILFHEWRAETRAQLPAVLAELRRQGCTFHTFSELAEALQLGPPLGPPAP